MVTVGWLGKALEIAKQEYGVEFAPHLIETDENGERIRIDGGSTTLRTPQEIEAYAFGTNLSRRAGIPYTLSLEAPIVGRHIFYHHKKPKGWIETRTPDEVGITINFARVLVSDINDLLEHAEDIRGAIQDVNHPFSPRYTGTVAQLSQKIRSEQIGVVASWQKLTSKHLDYVAEKIKKLETMARKIGA